MALATEDVTRNRELPYPGHLGSDWWGHDASGGLVEADHRLITSIYCSTSRRLASCSLVEIVTRATLKVKIGHTQ